MDLASRFWKKCLPWIYFAFLSSFYWYLLLNFKSYTSSAGFSSPPHSVDNQAWSISCKNALLLPFILCSCLIPTTWQEGIFSSTCSLYHVSPSLCGFYTDSLNHTSAQRTDPIKHFAPSLNNIYQKNQNMFCTSSFSKIFISDFCSHNGHLVIFHRGRVSFKSITLFFMKSPYTHCLIFVAVRRSSISPPWTCPPAAK